MNFFDIVKPHLKSLTDNEHTLFDFVIKNMSEISTLSIREVSSMAYVSTATFLRFVRKIGFSGFGEFTTVIKFTLMNSNNESTDTVTDNELNESFRSDYLKNLQETIRVLDQDQLNKVIDKLAKNPQIFLFAKDTTKHLAEYIKYIYTMAGFTVSFPTDKTYRQIAQKQITNDSLVFIMSFNGENTEFIELLNDLIRKGKTPLVVSITQSDNNTIQNLSNINFYLFTDKITVNNIDIGSRISIIAIMEIILHQYLETYSQHGLKTKNIIVSK